jgi:hypothetical protein
MKSFLLTLAGLLVVLACTLGALFPMRWYEVGSDMAIATFGVAGAILALVLPAAGLARDAAQRVIDAYVEGTARAMGAPAPDVSAVEAQLTPTEWAKEGVAEVSSFRARAAAARWGSALVYTGFLLATISLLQVAKPVAFHIGAKPVLPWHLAAAAAMACLAVGALLFLPLTWWFWTTRALAHSEAALRYVIDQATQPSTTPQAPQSPDHQPSPSEEPLGSESSGQPHSVRSDNMRTR